MNWKGLRTYVFGAAVAMVPSLLDFVAGVPWQNFGVSPATGAMIGAGIMLLRKLTSGPAKF